MVVVSALQQNGLAIDCVDPSILVDALLYAPEDVCADRSFMLSVVQQNGMLLQFASGELCNSQDIVLQAIQQNGMALQFASPRVRANRRIVQIAVQQNRMALEFADPSIIAEVVRQHESGMAYRTRGPTCKLCDYGDRCSTECFQLQIAV